MNGSLTAPAPDQADWALAGAPDSVNATGLLAEDLEDDGGLTEVQTLILACVATVIPLFLGLLLILGVRMVWKKYKNHNVSSSGYDNDGLRREDSCDAVKSSSFMQSVEELKTSESQYSVLMPDDTVPCCYAVDAVPLPPLTYNSPPNNRFGDTNKTNLNGSIITLTMKNNHLIVETEERVPGVCAAESAAGGGPIASGADDRLIDYEYDDDEFDMEAEMLRREFREASLLANGCGGHDVQTAAVLEPSSQTQVDLTADGRPTAAAAAAAAPPSSQRRLQPVAAVADLSSGGSSSADSRVVDMAYAYGNQSEYTADDTASKHCGKTAVKPTTAFAVNDNANVVTASTTTNNNNNNNNHNRNHDHGRDDIITNNNIITTNNNNVNNNANVNNSNNVDRNRNAVNDDEYLVEQRMLGNGADGGVAVDPPASLPPSPPSNEICSPDDRVAAAVAT